MAAADAREGCRLYAVLEAGQAAVERLAAVFEVADVASVLIAPASAATLATAVAQPLVAAIQRAGAAALVAGDAGLARALGADGVHLAAATDIAAAYHEARGLLGPRAIVGADAGISRHDAMTLAEAGADYVAFGAPPHLQDRAKARNRRDEFIAWWAEIFEVPCVAFDVETAQEADALSSAGADFIAVTLAGGESPAAARERIGAIAATMRMPQPAG